MEKLEYFVVKPSVQLFGGIRVDKNTSFEVYNDDKTVHQIMKDLILTTEINKESNFNGIKSKEESKMTSEIPEGTVIVWSEETGYIIPNYVMVKPEEASNMLSNINNITTPIEEGTNKAKEQE